MRGWVLALAAALLAAGCATEAPPATPSLTPGPTPTASPTSAPTPTPTPPVPTKPFVEPEFDGERALAHVRAQVLRDDGTVRHRIPGTEGNAEAARIIDATMSGLGYAVSWHHFNDTYGCAPTAMHNVVAERAGTSGRVVILAAHYDTRAVAEKDPDPERRDDPIPGANDGGSGVGVLLELARVLPPGNDTLRFVFFDGEDGGGSWNGCEGRWILGSLAYARTLSHDERHDVRAFVLLDMVGDPGLRLPRESSSAEGPGAALQDRLWGIANGLGHAQFVNESGFAVHDDHVPFLAAEIPAVDVIHLEPGGFPATHHTHADDLEHVSAASLAAVGRTVETWWRQLEEE